MRIVVDRDLCQGHGECQAEAPHVFTLPKHGTVEVLDEHPGDAERAAVHEAVRYCPTGAISVTDD
ncbi:ferredoxin [Skermania piniformis]|uniref:Ferredoxin n=1 Tax=Skermania pinensis TaxID=39122 RepID=A0ABX8S4V6_9ACTN|nr:ferredoxin [Skermania piniformis]QXQ12476.1 ferredoxin [Skermania piniformis]